MRQVLKLVALALPLALAVGCGKAPAEAALKAADEAIEAVRPDAEKYVADEFKGLADAAAEAKAAFDKGDYKAAMTAAQELPAKAQAVGAAAAAKKEAMTQAWSAMAAGLPGMVDAIKAKVTELAAMKRLPKGMDKAKLDEAKAGLDSLTQSWGEADTAAKAGDVTGAMAKGNEVQTKVEGMMAALGMVAPAAPAEAAPATK